jgi:uncharacterized protein DUF3455
MLKRFRLKGLKGEVRQPSFTGGAHEERPAAGHSDHAPPHAHGGVHRRAAATDRRRRHRTAARTPDLEVPAGNEAFLEGHAIGTQNYICLPSEAGVAWTLVGPQATLFNRWDRQLITHFLSPNPDERDTPRATWQHSRDTSTVWAVAIASSSDPNFVASGAIPWLLLRVVGAQPGPTGGDRLTETTFIQRVHTSGGVAPSTGCVEVTDVGQRAFVPYTADYFFYDAATDE